MILKYVYSDKWGEVCRLAGHSSDSETTCLYYIYRCTEGNRCCWEYGYISMNITLRWWSNVALELKSAHTWPHLSVSKGHKWSLRLHLCRHGFRVWAFISWSHTGEGKISSCNSSKMQFATTFKAHGHTYDFSSSFSLSFYPTNAILRQPCQQPVHLTVLMHTLPQIYL